MQASGAMPAVVISPPIKLDLLSAILLIIGGAMIEQVPQEYHEKLSNPLIFLIGMFFAAGFAAIGLIPLAFAMAFFLVNLLRIMPKRMIIKSTKNTNPGEPVTTKTKEGFQPSGTIDWVTNQKKKWFVEKVLEERPIAIQEKEVATYPIQS